MTLALGTTMDREVLRCGDRTIIVGIRALQATHELIAQSGRQERILSICLLSAAPAWIAKDVDVWRPDCQPEVNAVHIVADRLIEFRTRFRGKRGADLAKQRSIPGSGHADGLRKQLRVA